MSRHFDNIVTQFSPEGRLYQVEYAMEAVAKGSSCLGIVADDGVVLAVECGEDHELLDTTMSSLNLSRINENMACGVAGLIPDAKVLIAEMRKIAQRYSLAYGEVIPCEQLVTHIADIKQSYTQYGGKRPFGVSELFIGWDHIYGYQLYQSDPSGNFDEFRATCIGKNFAAAKAILRVELLEKKIEKLTLEDAKILAIKVMSTIMGPGKLTPEMLEMGSIRRVNNDTIYSLIEKQEMDELIKKNYSLEAEGKDKPKNMDKAETK
ncbi:hypothetical protein KR018_008849, partial [Drosophila ironensis]